jgi:hypothetical protein
MAPIDVSLFFNSQDGEANFPFLYSPSYEPLLSKLTSSDYATVSYSDGVTIYTAVAHKSVGTDPAEIQEAADFVLRQTVVE